MPSSDLQFNVAAIDKASKSFVQIAGKVERLSEKLDKIDGRVAKAEVDVNVNKSLGSLGKLGKKLSSVADLVSGGLTSSFKGLAKSGPLALAAVAGGLAALPAAAFTAATAITVGLGGAIAGIGLLAAAQSEKVQKAFGDLKSHVVSTITKISEPFEDTLVKIAGFAERTFNKFVKPLREAFEEMAPTITVFADQFFKALEGLAPAIQPITDAFNAILRQIGPQLGPVIAEIGESIAKMARVVEENAPLIADLFIAFVKFIPPAIDAVSALASGFRDMVFGVVEGARVLVSASKRILQSYAWLADKALDAFGVIVNGAARAFAWVPGVGPKLRSAAREFNQFEAAVDRQFQAAITTLDRWERRLERLPDVYRLRGDIRDLKQKIRVAKQKLASVPPSKSSDIRANIAQLERKLAVANDKLDAIDGRTVTVRVGVIGAAVGALFAAGGVADGGTVGGAAEGMTVPGPRRPYGDKVLRALAPGEEVISNRHGQADRNRSLLKAINAGRMANGGTVSTAPGSSAGAGQTNYFYIYEADRGRETAREVARQFAWG